VASGNICSATCSKASDCPAGWSCENQTVLGVSGQEKLCTPPNVE
jgi:hypothetical protein